MFSNILVAYDGSKLSKKALEHAIAIAKNNGNTRLEAVVVENTYSFTIAASYGVYSHELIEEMKKKDNQLIKELEHTLKELPNPTKATLLSGSPGQAIVQYASDNDVDLIVMGSRGLSGVKEFFLGSVSHFVVQHSKCPVFILK